MSTSYDTPDSLLQYCMALDKDDIETVKRILHEAETNEALDTSITELHMQYDSSDESFTAQLRRMRGENEQR